MDSINYYAHGFVGSGMTVTGPATTVGVCNVIVNSPVPPACSELGAEATRISRSKVRLLYVIWKGDVPVFRGHATGLFPLLSVQTAVLMAP